MTTNLSRLLHYIFKTVGDSNVVKLLRYAQRFSSRGKDLISNSNHNTKDCSHTHLSQCVSVELCFQTTDLSYLQENFFPSSHKKACSTSCGAAVKGSCLSHLVMLPQLLKIFQLMYQQKSSSALREIQHHITISGETLD